MSLKKSFTIVFFFCSITLFSQKQQNIVSNTKVKSNSNQENAAIKTASIDPVKTYERLGEKGYKLSLDQLVKVANNCYFNGELEKAAKFYNELFLLTQDLDVEFYFRYAKSLKSINEYAKADEMMKIFNKKKG
jgi:hypothetical protein